MTQPRAEKGPFDAVLLISFGGPQGMDDIRPFLENVVRGRRIPAARIEEVARHYEHFGGVSPLTEITNRQAAGLRERLQRTGPDLPVYVGMRNWRPFLTRTLCDMADAGIRRAIGFILAAHKSYSSCGQYKQDVIDARRELVRGGRADVEITYVDDWHEHEGFIGAAAQHVREALAKLGPGAGDQARIIFTAHSIPIEMAEACNYVDQLTASSRLVAQVLGWRDWALVYQSRSGRPTDPWLVPDICDYLRDEKPKGLQAAVVTPIGFLCDHIEVLYDLDCQAADVCRELNLPMVRAETVNDDPVFVDMMADVVRRTCRQHRAGLPLPIVAPETSETNAAPQA